MSLEGHVYKDMFHKIFLFLAVIYLMNKPIPLPVFNISQKNPGIDRKLAYEMRMGLTFSSSPGFPLEYLIRILTSFTV